MSDTTTSYTTSEYLTWLTAQLVNFTVEELAEEVRKDPIAAADNLSRYSEAYAAQYAQIADLTAALAWLADPNNVVVGYTQAENIERATEAVKGASDE